MHPILKAHVEKREFHHAYLLCGEAESGRKQALEAAKTILSNLSTSNVNIEVNPDFLHKKCEFFGIADSRELKNWAAGKSFYGSGKVYIIETASFTLEAANALLKILEEPNEGNYFFVIAPSPDAIIPTLRSRFVVIDLFACLGAELPNLESAENFLAYLPNKRMAAVKPLFEEKQKAVEFLNGLEIVLERELANRNEKAAAALDNLAKSRQFIFDRGASAKMILEHLALTLPLPAGRQG